MMSTRFRPAVDHVWPFVLLYLAFVGLLWAAVLVGWSP